MSREGTPSSDTLIDIDNFDENEVTDLGLKNLLKREIELQLLIDALQTEISQLEERINGKDKGDEEEELDDQGMLLDTKLQGITWAHYYGITDLEEYEAPEWCVPIKANVMNFDWDVSYSRWWYKRGWIVDLMKHISSHLQKKFSSMSLLLIHHGNLLLMLLLVV